jgi:hypothetical protein
LLGSLLAHLLLAHLLLVNLLLARSAALGLALLLFGLLDEDSLFGLLLLLLLNSPLLLIGALLIHALLASGLLLRSALLARRVVSGLLVKARLLTLLNHWSLLALDSFLRLALLARLLVDLRLTNLLLLPLVACGRLTLLASGLLLRSSLFSIYSGLLIEARLLILLNRCALLAVKPLLRFALARLNLRLRRTKDNALPGLLNALLALELLHLAPRSLVALSRLRS